MVSNRRYDEIVNAYRSALEAEKGRRAELERSWQKLNEQHEKLLAEHEELMDLVVESTVCEIDDEDKIISCNKPTFTSPVSVDSDTFTEAVEAIIRNYTVKTRRANRVSLAEAILLLVDDAPIERKVVSTKQINKPDAEIPEICMWEEAWDDKD